MNQHSDVATRCSQAWSRFRADAEDIHASFVTALERPAETQQNKLENILRSNADSDFGQAHQFASIRTFDEYAARVPVATWKQIQPWVERVCTSGDRVLTNEAPLFLERTSGSSAASKLIPYTSGLLGEFQRALIVWFASLYDDCPEISDGRSYWAMSPPAKAPDQTSSGIRIGSASDADYLANSCAMQLMPSVFGPSHDLVNDDEWRLATLAELLEAEDLSMISVWSPTFLTALLNPLYGEKDLSILLIRLSSAAQSRVQKALMSGRFDELWPALKVVSCWMDGPSEELTKQLSGRFSGCRFSPKGLLATEGVVSFSWGLSGLCPLAIDSHVLEFLDENDKRHLAHELVCGERYRPLISTAGGLYRYDLGDWIEVTALMHNTPCVRFVGRGDTRSDLVGEKLDDDIVAKALQVIASRDLGAFLVPVVDGENARYRLVVQNVAHSDVEGIASLVEAELMRVVHYAQARKLAQLAPLDVVSTNDCGTLLQRAWEATGRRAGDLKPAHLVVSPEMARAIIDLTNGQSKEQTI